MSGVSSHSRRREMRFYYTMLTLALLVSCSGSDDSPDMTTVYDTELHRGCSFPGNKTLQQSAQELSSSGVDVVESRCAMLTGVAFIEKCGAPSGQIFIHEIHSESVTDAESQGYIPVGRLADFETDEGDVFAEVGYEETDCLAK
jgi:hypothetical protein